MANKITKRMVINDMLSNDTICENQMYVDYLTHELELLDKKSKPTKNQLENDTLKTDMVSKMEGLGSMSATECGKLIGVSCSKASALLKQLVEDGRVVKTIEKKQSLFSVA